MALDTPLGFGRDVGVAANDERLVEDQPVHLRLATRLPRGPRFL